MDFHSAARLFDGNNLWCGRMLRVRRLLSAVRGGGGVIYISSVPFQLAPCVQPDRVIRSRVTIDSQIFSLGNRRLLVDQKNNFFFPTQVTDVSEKWQRCLLWFPPKK